MKTHFLSYQDFLVENNLVYINAQDTPGKDVLGTLDADDPKFSEKVNSIKNTLAESAFNHLKDIAFAKLPPAARAEGAEKVKNLAKRLYTGGPENLGQIIDLLENNPLPMSSTSMYGNLFDPYSALASYYKGFSDKFFQELYFALAGDMGPGELMFSVFTTFQKGTKGDLYDPINKRNVEVKGKNGRLSPIGRLVNGVDALDNVNKILGSEIVSRGISSTTIKKDIFPAVANKKFTRAEAAKFVLALSQMPDSLTSYKEEMTNMVMKGIKTPDELSNLFLAIQMLTYKDYAGFDDIMVFTDGNTHCQILQITGAPLSQILSYGNIISYSSWYTSRESTVGIYRKKR
jgi:hypothetical protein